MRELERELGLTARAVGEKATQAKGLDDSVMVKLLDQYSERLVNMLDEKIAASVAQRVRESSVGNFSDGADSPVVAQHPSRSRAGSEDIGNRRTDDSESGTEILVLETTEKLTME